MYRTLYSSTATGCYLGADNAYKKDPLMKPRCREAKAGFHDNHRVLVNCDNHSVSLTHGVGSPRKNSFADLTGRSADYRYAHTSTGTASFPWPRYIPGLGKFEWFA